VRLTVSDYTEVWKELNAGKHVLLLVEHQGDDEYFQLRLEDIRKWFWPIVKSDCGPLDLLMGNDAFLVIRKFVAMPTYPFDPEKEGVKVMWVRYGKI
jgi:hypothetical protein